MSPERVYEGKGGRRRFDDDYGEMGSDREEILCTSLNSLVVASIRHLKKGHLPCPLSPCLSVDEILIQLIAHVHEHHPI